MTHKEEEKDLKCYKWCQWGAGFLAALLFFVGSFMLFPYVESVIEGVWYFSVMFLTASILMVIRTAMELSSFSCGCHCKSVNCLAVAITFLAWFTFTVGSVLGSPPFDLRNDRDSIYKYTTLAIMLVRLFKLMYLFRCKISNFCYNYYKFKLFILTESFIVLSMLFFFIGTLIFY